MIPEKSCSNCKFFKKKEYLAKNNQTITKDYCLKFEQELFSHKACPKFRYTPEIELEVDTIYGTIGVSSGMLMIISFIMVIFGVVIKSDLIQVIALIITILSMISLITFMTFFSYA